MKNHEIIKAPERVFDQADRSDKHSERSTTVGEAEGTQELVRSDRASTATPDELKP